MPLPTPCRVLVVDDHPDTAESMARIIQVEGHEADFITDPQQVDYAIERFKPHVLFLDIAMPGLDGWTIAERLRARFPAGTLKMVAVTAFAASRDHARSRQAGFDAHVAKPVDPDLVGSILEQCFTETLRLPK